MVVGSGSVVETEDVSVTVYTHGSDISGGGLQLSGGGFQLSLCDVGPWFGNFGLG